MKTFILLALACFLIGYLTGCQTVKDTPSAKVHGTVIQVVLTKALDPSHTGYAKFVHANQYFTIVVEADGLKCEDGVWRYTWLTYNRQSHFPIFSGLTWSSTGEVTLGKKP